MIRGGEIVFGLVAILAVCGIAFVICVAVYGAWVKFQGYRRDREIQKMRGPHP